MTTIMFKREKPIVADIFNVVLEPLGNSRQVVFFCKDKMKNIYRVPKSEVVAKCASQPASKPKKDKKKRKCCA